MNRLLSGCAFLFVYSGRCDGSFDSAKAANAAE
jgi:hypothetical protein